MPRSSVVGADAIGFESESCKSLGQNQRKISSKPFYIFLLILKTGKFIEVAEHCLEVFAQGLLD